MTISRVLIVDDEPDICELIQDTLQRKKLVGDVCYTLNQAKEKLLRIPYDLVLTDMNLKGESGLELVSHVVQNYPQIPIVMMSAYGNQDVAIAALKVGAFDFLNKPINTQILINLIGNISDRGAPVSEVEVLKDLIGESDSIKLLRDRIKKVSIGQAPVFITGESGVGKEIVANMVHKLSSRSDGPFVAINCGAIPADLLESELFGYVKGAFTGATTNKIGLIQQAHKGTLFLDEVAELPLMMQAKLLRAVQEKKIRPLGGEKEIVLDFRIISATHQNIEQLVNEKRFRQDLYFRLHVMDVKVPALRDRGRDVLMLANHFCKTFSKEWGLHDIRINTQAKEWLLNYGFAGNVRELINIIQRALTLCNGSEITVDDMQGGSSQGEYRFSVDITQDGATTNVGVTPPSELVHLASGVGGIESGSLMHLLQNLGVLQASVPLNGVNDHIDEILSVGLDEYIKDIERGAIQQTLESVHGSKNVAAKKLKITTRSLRYRMIKYGIAGADED